MQDIEKRFYLYAAVTDCLPVHLDQQHFGYRPIKVGKARCLRERSETINSGHKMEEKIGTQKSLPLAGCSKWKMIVSTKITFSQEKAEALESTIRMTMCSWSPRGDIDDSIKTACLNRRKSALNGLTEIRMIDTRAKKLTVAQLSVKLNEYQKASKLDLELDHRDKSVVCNFVNRTSKALASGASCLKINCLDAKCGTADIAMRYDLGCEGFLDKCKNPPHLRYNVSRFEELRSLPPCFANQSEAGGEPKSAAECVSELLI
jgi:hypothetical protein